MKRFTRTTVVCLWWGSMLFLCGCGGVIRDATRVSAAEYVAPPESTSRFERESITQFENAARAERERSAALPVERAETSDQPIGKFDFRNRVYPLPVGWRGAGMKEFRLENGEFPLSASHIGASYVGTKFGDVAGDERAEALVVVKIETGGSANPQIVYIFGWRKDEPEMIAYFRTGDRADGGLKDLRAEAGELVVQLYGQDRYLIGELETMRIHGDDEQLCCPTFFTRTRYKWNGSVFKMQGTRETYSIEDASAPPVENLGEVIEKRLAANRRNQ